ncbi:hypothetical protein STXM2123_4084 [Streptomyces sp. F-3]|nr:hypothetical protein STXM2123_4084 [Streptomyces sp. F-3]
MGAGQLSKLTPTSSPKAPESPLIGRENEHPPHWNRRFSFPQGCHDAKK